MPADDGRASGGARPNPFGSYSLAEAQRPAAPAAPPRNPFGSYNFSEAQRGAPEPPASPTAALSRTASQHTGPANQQQQQEQQQEQQLEPLTAVGALTGPGEHTTTAAAISIEQYAIRALYEEFRDRSAVKIDAIVDLRLDREPSLAKHLEQGADPIFDRTLEKLGLLARRHPRVIIELLLVWRKTTIDAADEFPLEGTAATAPTGPGPSGSFPGATDLPRQQQQQQQQPAAVSRAHYIVRERRSLVSVYILCRALSAVVEQLDAPHLEGDLGDRLEELVFGQVKLVNPDNLRRSANRREIQDHYARLVGRISAIRFSSMSDRFIAELERIPMVSSGSASDERTVVLLHNMRFIKLRVFPVDALDESAAFLLSCAKFYSRTSGSLRLKHAWAALLTELLMPMAAVVDVEVNLPDLVRAIDVIHAKAMKMAAKVRHVTVAFPLAAATLCVSRREAFHQRWLLLLEYCIQRLKDKQFRRVATDAILRMMWVYLFRYPESRGVVLRRIDSLSRIFFPATKLHAWPKTVPPAAFVYFLVCAACYDFEFTARQLLHTLLQTDSGWPGTTRSIGDAEPILDTLNPMRVGLAFQALVNVAAIATTASSAAGADSAEAAAAAAAAATAASTATSTVAATEDAPAPAPTAELRPPFPGVGQLSGLDVFAADAPAKGAAAVDLDLLPESISNALTTATSVVSRYCSVLYPVFGHYVLADERLWRQACGLPLFSSVVLTGSPFSLENTALQAPVHSRSEQRSFHGAQAAGAAAGALVGAGSSGAGGAGVHSGAASSKTAVTNDDAGDRRFIDDGSGAGDGNAGDESAAGGTGGGPRTTSDAIRQLVPRYSSDRQAYVNLMTVHTRCLPWAQIFWEQIEPQRLVEMLVHNVLHVDQSLAAESRACLLDLLCPPAIAHQCGLPAGASCRPAGMFATRAERLSGVTHAVVRATQVLRAVDERYAHFLVAGIYSCDARSSISLVQPGDPLVDSPGIWPFTLPQFGTSAAAGNSSSASGSRRFAHGANLSTASGASNSGGGYLERLDVTHSADQRADDGLARHAYSSSGQAGDVGSADVNAGPSSAAAAAAIAAALDAKARLDKTSSWWSSESTARELNGGYLHFYLDLIHFLQVVLYELTEGDGAAADAPGSDPPHTDSGSTVAAEGAAPCALIGDRSLVEWARLICAIEANAIAILCSTSARVRRLAVEVLYQAGVTRRILAALEMRTQPRQAWIIRGGESAYEVLNVAVLPGDLRPGTLKPLLSDYWSVPFGAAAAATSATGPRSQQPQSLARLAASATDADAALWAALFPRFIQRASTAIPDAMLIARTLVCQRLYQMQPLMNQYSEISVRPAGAGSRSLAYLRATSIRTHDKAGPTALRADLIGAFGSLFLFAVVSLPASDPTLRSGLGSTLGESVASVRSPKGGSHSTLFGSSSGNGHDSGSAGAAGSIGGSGGSSSRSRLAKTIARKLAPLKSTSRSSKQEQGVGLASIAQLVRVASVILRSDNAPLRQQTALALAHTPPMYLHELLHELRPLSDFLFDDGTAGVAHRNYLHVAGAAGSAASNVAAAAAAHGHGSGSPGGGALANLGGSPKASPQQLRTGTSTGGQPAPHLSKRMIALASGNGSTGRLGSDTEATSDSGSGASQARGRRANSFDAAVAGTGAGTGAGHGEPGMMVASASNVAAAAAAVAAAVNAGASSNTAFQTRRRRLRLSLAQIYKHVSRQLDALDQAGHALYLDEQIMAQLVTYVRETKTFLSESSTQWEWEHQPLRAHLCGLVEGLYFFLSSPRTAARQPPKPSATFTHETRSGLYQLCERWCGRGRYAKSSADAQERLIALAVDGIKDAAEKEQLAAALEDERQQLELAALRAMAVLCRSEQPAPALASGDGEPGGPREKGTLFAWVSDALACRDARMQLVAQCAVAWTVLADAKDAVMLRVLIQLAYGMSVAGSIADSPEIPAMAEGRSATSGLGLLLGGGGTATGTVRGRSLSDVPALPAAPPSSRAVLGYLQALTAVLSPQPAAAAEGAHAGIQVSRSLSQTYVGLVLPLACFHLHSERSRVRRQALLLLRALCLHMPADSCLRQLDGLGTGIVSDIPAVAARAVDRLADAVARAFAVHTQVVLVEIVRQVHVQAAFGRRGAGLQQLVRPWLANVELQSAEYADDCTLAFDLAPVALSRDSVLVLRCMLYLTVKADADAMATMQTLWMALVDHDTRTHSPSRSANMWLVIRYLIGLLGCAWSAPLLGITRHIAVFLSRSSQGVLLVQQLADEAMSPGASAPIAVSEAVAQRAVDDAPPGEAWAKEIQFLLAPASSPPAEQPLLSGGALAVYYLGAISYEQAPLLAGYKLPGLLAAVVFALAHPERQVRDAARTVLVNLVSCERAECAVSAKFGDGLRSAAPSRDLAASEAAHVALSVLRSDECAAGFGNVDATPDIGEPTLNDDSGEVLPSEWPATATPGWSHPGATGASSQKMPANNNSNNSHDSVVVDLAAMPPTEQPIPQRGSSGDYCHAGDTAGRERAALQRLVVSLSRLFGRPSPGCVQGWADTAVQWAMSCPVRPLAGLALQTYGVLAAEAQYGGAVVITPTRQIVLRLVDRLSNVIGDATPELAAFSETVLAGIRQTAGLAARMCAGDTAINADLLAAGLVVMRTTQSAAMYGVALSIFERAAQLAAADEPSARVLAAERIGALAADGYQAALLRGLGFATCRDRCLALLRDTLPCDVAAGSRAHAMLALAAHLPLLIEGAVHAAAAAQRVLTADGVGLPQQSPSPAPATHRRRGGHRHAQQPQQQQPAGASSTPAAAAALGSSLSLMFAGGSPAQTARTSPRRPLFRRRGHGQWAWQRDTPDSAAGSAADSTIDNTPDASEGEDGPVSQASSDSPACAVPPSGLDAAQAAFVEQCLQRVLRAAVADDDARQFVQRLQRLLAPGAPRAADLAREVTELFGFAVAECGPETAGQTVVLLLQLLQPPGRARLALRYLRDEQVARTIGDPARPTELAAGYAGELRKLHVCLQLLLSVLAAADPGALRLDAAMAPALRHLFDLLIVARPISDLASRVLHTLLQRFADALPPPATAATAHGLLWYESDPAVLVATAREALAAIVARGFSVLRATAGAAESDASSSRSSSTGSSKPEHSATPRSQSPEMPVLVIPDASDDEVRVERLADLDRAAPEPSPWTAAAGGADPGDILAELDDFDKELDAALGT
ncbi:Cell morphogenesis protein PAG1 [Coemansia spiralis]|nr:Cell morphogenesis protein PAG1 [Coemansia spiralis]